MGFPDHYHLSSPTTPLGLENVDPLVRDLLG